MQIENLNIAARPRTAWQAVDLGILLAQQWYWPLLICFALPVAAIAITCGLLIPEYPTLSAFLVWWFKPLYERIPLSFLSTAIFGEAPTVKDALGRWRQCVLPGLLPALTYLRLSPTRSFKAPVLVLEGLKGATKAKRVNILNASLGNEPTWLTIMCVHVEAFLNIGLVVFAALLLPAELMKDMWSAYLEGLGVFEAWINNLFYFISIAVIGPFYVACGFSLYINARIELEAWDIELGFRKIVRRLSKVASVAALAMMVCITQVASVPGAHAETKDSSKATIEEILATEPYHQIETFSYPKFLESLDWSLNFDSPSDRDLNLGWLSWIPTLAEVCLWIIAVAAVLWVVYKLGLLEKLTAETRPEETLAAPEKLFGIALDSKTLPQNILQVAEETWHSGDQRAALSLLLRGWLLQMIKRYGCRFREADTEADCLRVVSANADANAHESFARLVEHWQRVAYAHKPAAQEDFDRLAAEWRLHWSPPVG